MSITLNVTYVRKVWVPKNQFLRYCVWAYRLILMPALIAILALYVAIMFLIAGRGAPGRIYDIAELIVDWTQP